VGVFQYVVKRPRSSIRSVAALLTKKHLPLAALVVCGVAASYPTGVWALAQGRVVAGWVVGLYVLVFAYLMLWFSVRGARAEIGKSSMQTIGMLTHVGMSPRPAWHHHAREHALLWLVALAAGYGVATKNYVLLALAAAGWWFVDNRLSKWLLEDSYRPSRSARKAAAAWAAANAEPPVDEIDESALVGLRNATMETALLEQSWFAELRLTDRGFRADGLPRPERQAEWKVALYRPERVLFTLLSSTVGRDGHYSSYLLAIGDDLVVVALANNRPYILRSPASRRYPQDLLRSLVDKAIRQLQGADKTFLWDRP
jgi:MFS family permease